MSAAVENLKYQLVTRRIGLWLFIVSESMIFLALLSTRFYMQGVNRPAELNQLLGLIVTGVLLLSSFTANRAEVFMSRGDNASFLRNIWITIVLGVVFLLGVVTIEWPEAMQFAPLSDGYGTLFFAITGMHALHVLTGLIVLLIVAGQARRGSYSAHDYWGAQGGVLYWHFVDVIWVFVYPILYLVG
jgi:cytochrome c oxidase subunit 3